MGDDLAAAVCGLAPERKGKEIRERRFSVRGAEIRNASVLAIWRKRSSLFWVSSLLDALASSCAPSRPSPVGTAFVDSVMFVPPALEEVVVSDTDLGVSRLWESIVSGLEMSGLEVPGIGRAERWLLVGSSQGCCLAVVATSLGCGMTRSATAPAACLGCSTRRRSCDRVRCCVVYDGGGPRVVPTP